jgi:iron complex outermembrane receptor protein
LFKIESSLRSALFTGAAILAGLAAPTSAIADEPAVEVVVVTGSMISGNANLVSPVTVIDAAKLERSGISTIQAALQQSNLNGGPALNIGWSAQPNFAAGASGISLRALSTNSTLVLFDGMRAAYYPLADDGVRNFVDLNTIPDDIVDRVEILKDGASASYGADAIAGVVNVVTKRAFTGLSARAEGGMADRGDAGSFRMSVTGGVGDLADDKLNFYVSAFYYHSDRLAAANRPYPFNTSDWTGICREGACGPNNIANGIQPNGTYRTSTQANFMVAPYNLNAAGQITTPVAGAQWQRLSDDCGPGTAATLTPAQQTAHPAGAPDYAATVCQYDMQKLFGVIQPNVTRFGLSGHGAFELPNGIEGWAEANYMQDSMSRPSPPGRFYGNGPAGIDYPFFSTSTNYNGTSPPAQGSFRLFLPVWVCPERTSCATAADRRLNPNNPFAAAGQAAALIGRNMTRPTEVRTNDRTYRVAGGLNGTAFGDVDWTVSATAMRTDLRLLQRNYVYMQHLIDVINDGSYNFIDTSTNSKALNDYLYPDNINNLSSEEAQLQATAQKALYKLWGGDLTLAVGASIAYEAVDMPSANPDFNGPSDRWFQINGVGAKGQRDVYSAFFEISAPVLESVVLDLSGRFDSYSSGQSNFSPKVGVWAMPIEGVTVKGTYSEGFRIPSFSEAFTLPTTGYVSSASSMFNDAYLADYGCTVATFSSCPVYISNYLYGQTATANPNLRPEKSRSWVFDLTWQPFDELQLSTTYYNIKKTHAIAQASCNSAQTAYYAGEAPPAGTLCVITPDAPDPSFPTARPRVAFVQAPFVNANAIRTAGFDFGVTWDSELREIADRFGLGDIADRHIGTVNVHSAATASFIQNLDTKFSDGTIQRYDGTLGNNSLTAGNGTSKWRGYWQTTFTKERYEFTSSLNWYSGYNLSATDSETGYRDCGLGAAYLPCRINDYFTWDANFQAHVRDDTTLYFTINNVLDNMPPVDTIGSYGSTGYNIVMAGDGILGRYIKLGIKLNY